jgi:hypothetical protein
MGLTLPGCDRWCTTQQNGGPADSGLNMRGDPPLLQDLDMTGDAARGGG